MANGAGVAPARAARDLVVQLHHMGRGDARHAQSTVVEPPLLCARNYEAARRALYEERLRSLQSREFPATASHQPPPAPPQGASPFDPAPRDPAHGPTPRRRRRQAQAARSQARSAHHHNMADRVQTLEQSVRRLTGSLEHLRKEVQELQRATRSRSTSP